MNLYLKSLKQFLTYFIYILLHPGFPRHPATLRSVYGRFIAFDFPRTFSSPKWYSAKQRAARAACQVLLKPGPLRKIKQANKGGRQLQLRIEQASERMAFTLS